MIDEMENKQSFKKDRKIPKDVLDPEWLDLVADAMNSQVSKEEFKDFIEYHKKMKTREPSIHTH